MYIAAGAQGILDLPCATKLRSWMGYQGWSPWRTCKLLIPFQQWDVANPRTTLPITDWNAFTCLSRMMDSGILPGMYNHIVIEVHFQKSTVCVCVCVWIPLGFMRVRNLNSWSLLAVSSVRAACTVPRSAHWLPRQQAPFWHAFGISLLVRRLPVGFDGEAGKRFPLS